MGARGILSTVLVLGLVGGALTVWAHEEKRAKQRKYPKKRRALIYSGKGKQRYVTLPQE